MARTRLVSGCSRPSRPTAAAAPRSTSGNLSSTVVEFNSGTVLHQWDITGKCDGLSADPATGQVIATVNEDLHSSL
jgi:hypothetical protein